MVGRRTQIAILALVAWGFAAPAGAFVLDFENITNNNATDAATAGQYQVVVSDIGGGQVRFDVKNDPAGAASSISDVYFEADLSSILDVSTMSLIDADTGGDPGVDFSIPAAPEDLPGGNTASPVFTAILSDGSSFSTDSDPAVPQKGINPGEMLGVVLSFVSGKTFADLEAAMTAPNDLRIGIHVIAFDSGGSESFLTKGVTPEQQVPTPASALLLLTGLVGLARLRSARRPR